jgi:hypothetical protein
MTDSGSGSSSGRRATADGRSAERRDGEESAMTDSGSGSGSGGRRATAERRSAERRDGEEGR